MYADYKTIALLARPNCRGITTDRLVYRIQDLRDKLDLLHPDDLLPCPQGCTQEEWIDDHKYFLEESIKGIEAEIERRRNLTYAGVQHTNSEIIQTIKNAIDITDVLSWYTEVFINKKQWTYRCILHGEDKHPSGVIYKDENRFHCFTCGKHGDIFDAVQYFERVDLPEAIKKLARHIGLDTKPLISRNKYRDITT